MGQIGNSPQLISKLQQAGFHKCLNQKCDYWLSPEEESDLEQKGYTFRCPRCKARYQWMNTSMFEGSADLEDPTGLSMTTQGELSESLIQQQGELPGYGRIVWWSTLVNDPIDGATEEWALEVKSVSYDAKHHRFIPGRAEEKTDKIARAKQLGYNNLLGVLVMLNFQKSVADVYVREMSVTPWQTNKNPPQQVEGFATFRTKNSTKLLEEIPFDNPFLNPNSEEPVKANAKSWFQGEDPHPIWNKQQQEQDWNVEDVF